jgi:hypothetical protein
MTAEQPDRSVPADANAGHANANADAAAHKEAFQYWGYLIKEDKCGTELFDRLLKGIADAIVSSARSFWVGS